MLISCPKCSTNFAVPAKAIGENGKKVKCSKCAHIWLQKPIEVDKDKLNNVLKVPDETKKEIEEKNTTANLPAKSYIKANISMAASLILLFLLTLVFSTFNYADQFEGLSSTLGLEDYYGLRFENFEVKSEVVDKKYDFFISGNLVNDSEKQIKLPQFNLKVMSKGGRTMAEAKVDAPTEFIEAKSKIPFNPDITGISGNAEIVVLEFGNWLDLMFR